MAQWSRRTQRPPCLAHTHTTEFPLAGRVAIFKSSQQIFDLHRFYLMCLINAALYIFTHNTATKTRVRATTKCGITVSISTDMHGSQSHGKWSKKKKIKKSVLVDALRLKVVWIRGHPPSPEALWFDSGLRAADWGQEGKRPSQQHHECSEEETDGEQRHCHQCDL